MNLEKLIWEIWNISTETGEWPEYRDIVSDKIQKYVNDIKFNTLQDAAMRAVVYEYPDEPTYKGPSGLIDAIIKERY